MGFYCAEIYRWVNGSDADVPISNMLYCKLCFDEQTKADKGMMPKVYSTSVTTSSGNHLSHASAKHGAVFQKPIDVNVTTWLTKAGTNSPTSTLYEFNRDLSLFICTYLQPFAIVEQARFVAFCKKNTQFELPSATTISSNALIDVYSVLKTKVQEMLTNAVSGTLMIDGWTDKYKRLPYFAVMLSFIHEWIFKILTLSISPMETTQQIRYLDLSKVCRLHSFRIIRRLCSSILRMLLRI